MLEDWKLDILRKEVEDMEELIAWLDGGRWLSDVAREAAEAAADRQRLINGEPRMLTPEVTLRATCRLSQMANTLYGTEGYAATREERLVREATPKQVREAAVQRRQRAIERSQ